MKLQKNIIFLLYSTLFFVIIWIISSIYHIFSTSTISPDLQLIVTPIPNTFNGSVINLLQQKKQVSPIYSIINTTASPSAELSSILPPSASPASILKTLSTLNNVENNATSSAIPIATPTQFIVRSAGLLP